MGEFGFWLSIASWWWNEFRLTDVSFRRLKNKQNQRGISLHGVANDLCGGPTPAAFFVVDETAVDKNRKSVTRRGNGYRHYLFLYLLIYWSNFIQLNSWNVRSKVENTKAPNMDSLSGRSWPPWWVMTGEGFEGWKKGFSTLIEPDALFFLTTHSFTEQGFPN